MINLIILSIKIALLVSGIGAISEIIIAYSKSISNRYTAIPETISILLLYAVFSAIIFTAMFLFLYITYPKRFTKMIGYISTIAAKHQNKEPNPELLKMAMCEIRSIFCKHFKTNEIGISVFKYRDKDIENAYLEQVYSIDYNGIINDNINNPARFKIGEGFIGKAWQERSTYFGNKYRFFFFLSSDFKVINNQRGNAQSFFCFPIHNDNGSINAAISIESSSKSLFNWSASRDDAHFEISNNISAIVNRHL